MSQPPVADVESAPAPTQDKLDLIVALARAQWKLERDIEKSEEALRKLKEEHRMVSERTLPDALLDVGMTDFGLADGSRVELSINYHGNIPKEEPMRSAGFAALSSIGGDSLVKYGLAVVYEKGAEAAVTATTEWLRGQAFANAITFDAKLTVHPSTLLKHVREKLAEGVQVPFEDLGLYERRVTSITPPKAKGKKKA